ncbi:MAG: hypothetical protein ACRCW2_00885 [Cellulosilyticaceae bacterium]
MEIAQEVCELVVHSMVPQLNYEIRSYKNHVLKAIECFPDSPVYEEVCDLFETLHEEAIRLITPKLVWGIEPYTDNTQLPELEECEEVIYASATLGYAITEAIEAYFKRDELIEGMLLDAIATGLLFKVNETFYKEIYEYAKNKEKGLMAISPGERGTPIAYQRLIEEKLGHINDIRVTEGYLLEPIKSTTAIYGVSQDLPLPRILHNCKKCSDPTCKWRLAPYEG